MAARRKSPARKGATARPVVRKPSVRKAPARKPKSSPPSRATRASLAAKGLRLAGVGSDAVMRATWTVGDSSVEVGFFAKGADRSTVQVQHGKLKSAAAMAKQKAFWSDALARLKALLEPVT